MHARTALRACGRVLAAGAAPAFGQAHYTVADLGTLGGTFSSARAIVGGRIGGCAMLPGEREYHPALWTDGAIRDLGILPGTLTGCVDALNASGQAIGTAGGAGLVVPFRWTGSRLEELSHAGARSAVVNAIDSRGRAVGALWYWLSSAAVVWEPGTTSPTVLQPGLSSSANDVNDAGTIVGTSGFGTQYAFVWNGRMRLLGDAVDPADPAYGRVRFAAARRVNAADQVLAIGIRDDEPGVLRSFVLTPRIPRFAFGGFLPPVGEAASRVVKAGAAVPVKFSLGGYRGPDVLAAGFPRVVPCEGGGEGAPATTPGRAGLAYDTDSDTYTFVWKTEKAWAGTCRRFEVAFVDETPVREATFAFR